MIAIGIDPGNEGGIVVVNDRREVLGAHVMPIVDVGKKSKTGKMAHQWVLDKRKVLEILLTYINGPSDFDVFAVLEKSQAMPGQGISSTFKIGRDFGALEMALLSFDIRHQVVHPTKWQKVLSGTEGKGKQRAVIFAQRSLPHLNLYPLKKRTPHDGLADAACMALWALASGFWVDMERGSR